MANSPKTTKPRPDFKLFLGPALAAVCILGGLFMEGGKLNDLHQLSAALIVFGGTAGAMLLTTPFALIGSASRRLGSLLWVRNYRPAELVAQITDYARIARRHGLQSLEELVVAIEDPIWRKAMMLAVDGADEQAIRESMDLEMNIQGMEADNDAGVFEAAAGYAPTIGILGAIIGLIQVMKHIDDLAAVGAGIATAFVATVYGVGLANLVLFPLAQRLRLNSQRTLLMNELVVEGAIGIREGVNPLMLRMKLGAFAPAERTVDLPKVVAAKPDRLSLSA